MISRRNIILLPLSSLFLGCDSRPEEVGVFINASNGWKKTHVFDWEPFFGGYLGTEKLEKESLPKVSGEASIFIRGVPIDPLALYWGRNATKGRKGRLNLTLDKQPVTVMAGKDGTYEIKSEKLPAGLNALVQKGGQFSYRAYFFEVVTA